MFILAEFIIAIANSMRTGCEASRNLLVAEAVYGIGKRSFKRLEGRCQPGNEQRQDGREDEKSDVYLDEG